MASRRFRCCGWRRPLRCFGPTLGPFSRSPAAVGTAPTEPLRRRPLEARLTSPRVVTASFACARLGIGRSRFARASRRSARRSGSAARGEGHFRPSGFGVAGRCTGSTRALVFRPFLPARRTTGSSAHRTTVVGPICPPAAIGCTSTQPHQTNLSAVGRSSFAETRTKRCASERGPVPTWR
jgi:hypothetical protein